jgi:hypothetical protein
MVRSLVEVIVPPIRRPFTMYKAALQAFNKIEMYAPAERALKEFASVLSWVDRKSNRTLGRSIR